MTANSRPIAILMYHQIDAAPHKGSALRGLVVAPRTFYWHMAVMRLLGYRGLSMSDLVPYLLGRKQGRVFGITFDDGYVNNLKNALPVLTRFGFTSTCYVVPGLLGKTNVWDAEHGIDQVPLMDAADLQTWIAAGQEIGSHTMTHARLPGLDDAQLGAEVAGSKGSLEAMLMMRGGVRHFCYPYGAYDAAALNATRAGGYVTATTTVRGRVLPGESLDMLQLPRVLVSRTTTWAHLLLKCVTRYEDKRATAPLVYDQNSV
jgi:peptidoglycan/xylan/chitin deacetylase (PgdA/CDA1 family)